MEAHAIPISKTDGGRPPAPSVFLQPIAPPVTLGLWGFFGSTMVISTYILGWWGSHSPKQVLFFFVINGALGGVAQFLAGLWSFKARDYIGSSLLTMWGTFWMAFAVLQTLGATHTITIPPLASPQPGYALWFIPLGTFTFLGSVVALSLRRGNLPLWLLLFTVGIGSWVFCAGLWSGSNLWERVAAWLFVIGALAAWYVGSMVMLESAWRRVILPLGRFRREANVPGTRTSYPTEYVAGQPGVRQGQP